MRNIIILSSLLFFLIGCSSKKEVAKDQKSDVKLIDYLFKEYNGNKPGASFTIIKDGKIEICKNYGYANLEKGIKSDCSTNYRLASVTKQFTAMGIMILINQGELNFETTLTDIFPTFPHYGNEITVRHLLTHRSGLIDYNDIIPKNREDQILDKEVLEVLKEQDSAYFKPNEKYRYSNSGYAVLAQIIEKVSQLSFHDFMLKEIFEPLGMLNTIVFVKGKEIRNRAFGYKLKDSIYELKDQSLSSAVQGDGGIYSSVADYYKWDQALYSDKIIPQNDLEGAFFNWDEKGIDSEKGYGYGWKINYYKGLKILEHGGSTIGFRNYVIRIPSEKISVAIYTNRDNTEWGLQKKAIALASLYSDSILMPIEILVDKKIDEKGVETAIKQFEDVKEQKTKYNISKEGLISLGFKYFRQNKNQIAIKIFELITNEYPDFFGGYFGLARVYKKINLKEKSINNFEKVVELSNNQNKGLINFTKKMLNELKSKAVSN